MNLVKQIFERCEDYRIRARKPDWCISEGSGHVTQTCKMYRAYYEHVMNPAWVWLPKLGYPAWVKLPSLGKITQAGKGNKG